MLKNRNAGPEYTTELTIIQIYMIKETPKPKPYFSFIIRQLYFTLITNKLLGLELIQEPYDQEGLNTRTYIH